MRPIDGTSNKFSANGSSGAVTLTGGQYELSGVSSNWGSGGNLTLDHLLPDGVTWFSDATIKLTASGVANGYLSPGQYRLSLSGTPTSPVFSALSRIPGE